CDGRCSDARRRGPVSGGASHGRGGRHRGERCHGCCGGGRLGATCHGCRGPPRGSPRSHLGRHFVFRLGLGNRRHVRLRGDGEHGAAAQAVDIAVKRGGI